MKSNCKWCDKVLPTIGNKRKNGRKDLNDWDERKYHVQCYSKMKIVRDAMVLCGHCTKDFDEKYC